MKITNSLLASKRVSHSYQGVSAFLTDALVQRRTRVSGACEIAQSRDSAGIRVGPDIYLERVNATSEEKVGSERE